jgi:hypothetical protein
MRNEMKLEARRSGRRHSSMCIINVNGCINRLLNLKNKKGGLKMILKEPIIYLDMKRLVALFVTGLVIFGGTLQAQKTTLTFIAQLQDGSYVALDSIQIKNQTQSWSETLIYPDTVLEMGTVGIVDLENKEFGFSGVIPNPFNGCADVSLYLYENEHLTLALYDINGKEYVSRSLYLEKGKHRFHITTEVPQMYLLEALTAHGSKTIKLQNQGQGAGYNIEYDAVLVNREQRASTIKSFTPNDDMLYIGYRTKDNRVDTVQIHVHQEGINSTHIFTFRQICIFDNPLTDLVWLKQYVERVENLSNNGTKQYIRIYQCTYKYGIGFLIEPYDGIDVGYDLHDCEGKYLCTMWGFTGNPCSQFTVDFKNKELIYELID